MSQSPASSKLAAPTANNVFMDINSDCEAEQEAQDAELILQQAQVKLRLVNEAQEHCREEWKRLEEEKTRLVLAMKLAVEQAVELVMDREWRIQLQVSL